MVFKPSTNLWFNKGFGRRKQIYNWLFDIISFHYPTAFKNVATQYILGNTRTSLDIFKTQIIGNLIQINLENLGYLISENMDAFGKDRILLDLFNNVVLPNIKSVPVPKKRTKQLKAEDVTLKDFETKRRSARTTFLGVNKQGKRESAVLVFVSVRRTPQPRLRSVRTGRWLKQSKSFKQALKNRGF